MPADSRQDGGANRGAKGGASSRPRGRELALWVLCHLESYPGAEREAVELFWRDPPALDPSDEFLGQCAAELVELLADGLARRWARRLVEGYLDHAAATDAAIEAASERWRLVRMDRVDRNLLRIVSVELSHESTPRNVAVAEAVRLAARYGSERSPVFVNGLAEGLARILRDAIKDAAQPDEPGASETAGEEPQSEPDPESVADRGPDGEGGAV